MHTTRGKAGSRAILLVVALCLLFSVALTGVVALAAGENDNTMTLVATNSEEFTEDIATANVVADVYQIGAATRDAVYDTYSYTLFPAFDGFVLPAEPTASDWDALATKASELAESQLSLYGTVKAGETLEHMPNGLFLIMARGNSQAKGSLVAQSALWKYSFSPYVVALPTKEDLNGDDSAMTSVEDGEWKHEATVTLKPTRDQTYGSLVINKAVEGFEDEPAMFVFNIQSVGDDEHADGELYNNDKALNFTGGESDSVVVTHIPAGITVRVTEIYEGGRYERTSPDGQEAFIIPGETVTVDTASVSFANKRTTDIGGHGIENNYTYDGDDWAWTALPADNAKAA